MFRESQKIMLFSFALAGLWHVMAFGVRLLLQQPHTWADWVGIVIFVVGILVGVADTLLQKYHSPFLKFFGLQILPIKWAGAENTPVPAQPTEVTLADNPPVPIQQVEVVQADGASTPIQPAENDPATGTSKPWENVPNIANNREIVRMLWEGYSDKEIAQAFEVRTREISNKLSQLRADLGTDIVPTREMLKARGVKHQPVSRRGS